MCVSPITPSFTGRNIIIMAKDGANAQRPLLFNDVAKIMQDFQTTVIYQTGLGKISISDAPKGLEQALLKANITCRLKEGEKLKLII